MMQHRVIHRGIEITLKKWTDIWYAVARWEDHEVAGSARTKDDALAKVKTDIDLRLDSGLSGGDFKRAQEVIDRLTDFDDIPF